MGETPFSGLTIDELKNRLLKYQQRMNWVVEEMAQRVLLEGDEE